jgi:Glycosyl hydrolases family 35
VPEVRIAERRIWVGDQSRPLLSGEVHFWRLDPAVWPSVLERVGDLGLQIVSTYVCWDFHEVRPGEFDFDGSTNGRRNLLGFLDLAARMGFWVLLRPGPYIYAEWPNSGVPERVVQWHRLHPRFVEEAKVWMAAVVSAVHDRLATHGGPVVLLQADNEADAWTDVYGLQLGLGDTPGLFQEFLEHRYAQIAELNAVWSASYGSFSQVRAVLSSAYDPFAQRYRDFCRFRHWYATEVVRWTAAEYRRLGVDIPIMANTYIDTAVQDWRALSYECDLVGPDIYPTSGVADGPDEHRGVLDSLRYARCVAPLGFIPEFESGIWHGWHRWVGTLTATHSELNAYSAMLAGASGWNWYMLVGRDSWYMSPISDLGRFRPELAPAYADIVRVFCTLDPPGLSRVCETAATFNSLERAADPEAGQAVLRALYAADIDYEFFDLDAGRHEKPVLFYAGGRTVSSEQLLRLHEYVEGGGTLMFLQPPALDGLSAPPVRVTTAAAPQRVRLSLGSVAVDLSSDAVFVYSDGLGESIVAERTVPLPPTQEGGHAHVQLPVGERLRVGYTTERGRGRVIVLGIEPEPELMVALHAWLGVPIPSRASAPRVQSALFERGGERFVIVTNTAGEDREVVLHLDLPSSPLGATDLRTGREASVVARGVVARVPARSGTAVRLA